MSYTPLSFTANGSTLVYSNTPESISSDMLGANFSRNKCLYTVKYNLPANKIVNIEYYHSNVSGAALSIGVMLVNTATAAVRYRIRRLAVKGSLSGNVANALQCNTTFYQQSIDTTGSVPINYNTSQVVAKLTSEAKSSMNGKLEIQALGSGITAYVVIYDSSKITPSASNIVRATPDANGRTSAVFTYNHRATGTITPVAGKKYLLFASEGDLEDPVSSPLTFNNNEYPLSESSNIAGKDGIGSALASGKHSRWLCLGNFGCVYDINLVKAAGRKLLLKPTRSSSCGLLIRANSGVWYPYNFTKTSPYNIKTDSLTQLSIVLVGGNEGDIKMYFE